jgi:hypothetical protein
MEWLNGWMNIYHSVGDDDELVDEKKEEAETASSFKTLGHFALIGWCCHPLCLPPALLCPSHPYFIIIMVMMYNRFIAR